MNGTSAALIVFLIIVPLCLGSSCRTNHTAPGATAEFNSILDQTSKIDFVADYSINGLPSATLKWSWHGATNSRLDLNWLDQDGNPISSSWIGGQGASYELWCSAIRAPTFEQNGACVKESETGPHAPDGLARNVTVNSRSEVAIVGESGTCFNLTSVGSSPPAWNECYSSDGIFLRSDGASASDLINLMTFKVGSTGGLQQVGSLTRDSGSIELSHVTRNVTQDVFAQPYQIVPSNAGPCPSAGLPSYHNLFSERCVHDLVDWPVTLPVVPDGYSDPLFDVDLSSAVQEVTATWQPVNGRRAFMSLRESHPVKATVRELMPSGSDVSIGPQEARLSSTDVGRVLIWVGAGDVAYRIDVRGGASESHNLDQTLTQVALTMIPHP